MALLVFKTSAGPRRLRVGSIPMRLRQFNHGLPGPVQKATMMDNSTQTSPTIHPSRVKPRHVLLSVILVAVGVGLFVYGFFYRTLEVRFVDMDAEAEKEEEPAPFNPEEFFGQAPIELPAPLDEPEGAISQAELQRIREAVLTEAFTYGQVKYLEDRRMLFEKSSAKEPCPT